jgi:putative hydrolase of the HAD superfamily
MYRAYSRPLGVITNGTDVQQRGKLERMGIADRFSVILTSEAAGLGKPDPRIFVQAAARLNAPPDRCVHVGDDWMRDVEGARGAGFAAIWLDRRREGDDASEARDRTVPRIAVLTQLLELLD